MTNTITKTRRPTDREIFYFRQRQKNRVYQAILRHFSQQAESVGLTKSDIASALGKERSQISRWFAGPANLELDTISDLLLAMGAEMDHEIVGLDEVDVDTGSTIHFGSANVETRSGSNTSYTQMVEFG
jgi:transcriptional regulator with XRE-family HTH domain